MIITARTSSARFRGQYSPPNVVLAGNHAPNLPPDPLPVPLIARKIFPDFKERVFGRKVVKKTSSTTETCFGDCCKVREGFRTHSQSEFLDSFLSMMRTTSTPNSAEPGFTTGPMRLRALINIARKLSASRPCADLASSRIARSTNATPSDPDQFAPQ